MPLDVAALGPGDVLAGKFKIVRRLGEGGMGAVFEVEHMITKHHRAMKLLHAGVASNAAVVQRFLREASAAGRIGDPHIAETFDAGALDTGEPYLVMEFLRGKTLGDLLASRGGRLDLGEIVELITQACRGVAAAHAAGIIHRDLKPDNLFVVEREGKPFVKVLDFGISKFDSSLEGAQPITREGSMLGTPYYMSPEQFRGEAGLDERADVYSLGVILYECAAGRRPYEAASLHELMYKIIEGKPPALASLRPDLPPTFIDLVERATSPDRERRPASIKQLSDELAALSPASAPASPLSPPLALSPTAAELPAVAHTTAPAPGQASRRPLALLLAAPLLAVAAYKLLPDSAREAPRPDQPTQIVSVVVASPPATQATTPAPSATQSAPSAPASAPAPAPSTSATAASSQPAVAPSSQSAPSSARSALPGKTAGPALRSDKAGLSGNPY